MNEQHMARVVRYVEDAFTVYRTMRFSDLPQDVQRELAPHLDSLPDDEREEVDRRIEAHRISKRPPWKG